MFWFLKNYDLRFGILQMDAKFAKSQYLQKK